MVSRRTTGILAFIATILVALSYVSLLNVETSVLHDLTYVPRAEKHAASTSQQLFSVPTNTSLKDAENATTLSEANATVSSSANTTTSDIAVSTTAASANATTESTVNAITASMANATSSSDSENDDQLDASSTAGTSAEPTMATPSSATIDTAADDDLYTTDDNQGADANEPALEMDADELMTAEYLQREFVNDRNRIDPLAPVQVHLVWIGDVRKAPRDHTKYATRGFNLTVHTDAEEILAGFQPFVLRAYNLALPRVVGFDFLKFALLYKYGGLAVDADTTPAIDASELDFPSDCDVVFTKEATPPKNWVKPKFRVVGGPTYGLNRPFQILNWAMAARGPRNQHIKWLMRAAMAQFFGLRDMENSLIQDISGSGLMTDYVALLHEEQGRNYRDVYDDHTKYVPVEGLCLTDGYLHGTWIHHSFLGSWKKLKSDP